MRTGSTSAVVMHRTFLTAALCVVMSGCGGHSGNGPTSSPTITSVSVSCLPTSVAPDQTSQCKATVVGTGGYSSAVTWSVDSGHVSETGLFTASATTPNSGTSTVKATSTEDKTKAGSAAISIVLPPTITSVTVSCNPTNVAPGQTSQCSATVAGTGSYSSAVTWLADSGTVSASGLYTAPTTAPGTGTATVKATSTEDTTKTGTVSLLIALPPTITSVTVSCSPTSIQPNQTSQCTAAVAGTGSYSSAVTWSVDFGIVSASGLYTAPTSAPTSGTATVKATSIEDTTKAGSATISIVPPPTITAVKVSCNLTSVAPGQASQCSATVAGTGGYSSSVTWSVDSGMISAAGLYTAPTTVPASGTATVKATSTEDTTKSGSAAISIVPPPTITSVTVSCNPTNVAPGQTSQCAATVAGTGSYSSTVIWSADSGTVSSSGLYTAPTTAPSSGSASVKATSTEDPTKTGAVSLSIAPPPSITSITVSCSPTSIAPGQTSQCKATVTGTGSYSSAVTWSADSGGVSATGLFTAPATVPSSGAATVKATSTQDTSKAGTASISIMPLPPTITSVSVSCSPASLALGQTSQCAATAVGTGSFSSAVTWTADSGTVSPAGLYTAPATYPSLGVAAVTATSTEDITKSGTAALTIPLPTIGAPAVSPTSIPLGTATTITVTTVISNPSLVPGSVTLLRLDSSGRVIGTLGTLHDDGLNGDAKANDGVFTLQAALTEFAVGPISFQVSAAFNGAINHILSTVFTVSVTGAPPPRVTILYPANLSYLNLSPTTISGTVDDTAATIVINSIPAVNAQGAFSATVPLAEGPNIITVSATSTSGAVGTASEQVTLDTTPPHVTITSPPDQLVTSDAAISVAGNVNDTVVGTVNSRQATVKVNGIASQVANRTFLAANVPLVMGANTIQVVAVDRAGNSATTQITITRQSVQPGQIAAVSGNNQTAMIGTSVSVPLTISLTDSSGKPAPNKQVIFTVTQNNGTLSLGAGTPAATVLATTNAQGQASATWTLGMRSGAGSDGAQAYSVGSGGTAIFTATATPGPAGLIVIDSGNNQTGAVNQTLPKPLLAVVVDAGHNRLSGVPVTFTVQQGGGSFGGQPSVTVTTDPDGRAAGTLTLGFQEGNSNNQITADFSGDKGFPASFAASGLGPGDPAKTEISGLVLDNSNQPIPGVTIRAVLTNVLTSNMGSVQTAATVQSDAKGQFTIYKAPVGYVKLLVDGSTATTPGTFPTLEYDMVTVAGQVNTVGQSIYLLPIKTDNQLCVTETIGGGTLTIPEAPGFSLTFGPGQVTFPGGSKTGCISVTTVHPDKVPMVPGFGQQPRFIVTIQPSGALFNPPAPITLPNVDGLAPREVTEMYSFDHDIGSFVAIGTGTVSDDGQVIRSNAGVGVLKAGWHCGGNPNVGGAAATCGPCATCNGTNCVANPAQIPPAKCQNPCLTAGSGTCDPNGKCTGMNEPAGYACAANGQCDGMGNCVFPGGGCPGGCNSGDPCILDSCLNGQCSTSPNPQCQNACNNKQQGDSCSVGSITGTCDANSYCQACNGSNAGAICINGLCDSNGQCQGQGNQCPATCAPSPDACETASCTNGACQSPTPLPRPVDTSVQPFRIQPVPNVVSVAFEVTLLPDSQDFSNGHLFEAIFITSNTCSGGTAGLYPVGPFTLSPGKPTIYHDQIGFDFTDIGSTRLPQASCSFSGTQQLLFQPTSSCVAQQVAIQQIEFSLNVLTPYSKVSAESCLKGVCVDYTCTDSTSGLTCTQP